MAFRPFHCRHCNSSFPHRPGADLHCSDRCAAEHVDAAKAADFVLREAGFTQDETTPNVYVKDGVAITIDQVIHEGLQESLRAHSAASKRATTS